MKTKFLVFAVLTFLFIVACQTDGDDIVLEQSLNKEFPTKDPLFIDLNNASWSFDVSKKAQGNSKSTAGDSGNREVVLYMAEYLTDGVSDEMGNTIFFNNRGNKQTEADFVADSQYLNLPPEWGIYSDGTNDISYYVDESRPSEDLDIGLSTQAIERSMTTWDDLTCSELGVFKRSYNSEIKTGAVLGNAHPIFDWAADMVHAGWMPLWFFDAISGGRGANILGVTFTFIVVVNGVPSDDDNDGKFDVWFREIYYNDAFLWTDGGTNWPEYDVETVALHEAGHGLSQGHFGKAFAQGTDPTDPRWNVHFAPRAVMNAAYSGVQTDIEKTDNGGHCSNWGQWPNN